MHNRIWMAVWIGSLAMAQDSTEQVKVKRMEGGRARAITRQSDPLVKSGPARDAALSSAAPFVPITPCRLMDTRDAGKASGFGPPALVAGASRTVPVPVSGCGIPAGAIAYSLNITVVPSQPLAFLTVYPTGQPRPVASTLNSLDGSVVANAALVPAGANGSIDLYVTDRTDAVVDINGYFLITGAAVQFYTVTPCRLLDSRPEAGKTGLFGPPSLAANATRDIPVPSSGCGIPATARAYLLNITVLPKQALAFLTAWPTGQTRPVASTLNSFQGRVVANAALVPAGTNGAISMYVTDLTDAIIDISGYLAP